MFIFFAFSTDMKRYWNKFNRPPKEALKEIPAGPLKGKTDINPMYRIQAMTEVFGPKGFGWYDKIVDVSIHEGAAGEKTVSIIIEMFVKEGDAWSDPIIGIGGATLINTFKGSLSTNDEAFKMAYTDAQSVAMKSLGLAADIYYGLWDGSKYKSMGIADAVKPDAPKAPAAAAPVQTAAPAQKDAPAVGSPVDNYRKHFLKVLQENTKTVNILSLGKYCLKNFGSGMDGINIDQMKSTLNMLKEKGHIPATTEV